MRYVKPEQVGISSANIDKYVSFLERKRLATHSIIMSKGDEIFYEKYWEPFDRNFLHRMYSVSKSFVSLAIGFLLQDKKICLDDTMDQHFAEELKNQPDPNMHQQTIRQMLMMETAKVPQHWFNDKPEDRVRYYFENDSRETRPAGTIFCYDSTGSFILGALVERIIGKPFMEYLREKLFCKIGVSEDAYCLKCPGGHSWGDSAVLCKPMDLWRVARFVMNKGTWNGERILDEEYLTQAVSTTVFNNYADINQFDKHGYGWQFWGSYEGSFCFFGMGCQYAVCIPEKDLILIYNGDNQGKTNAGEYIFERFFEWIADESVQQITEDIPEEKNYKLIAAAGAKSCEFESKINGVEYVMDPNPMGLKKFKLTFTDEGGSFIYTNEQGEKEILFGRCENVFGLFPQEGYANDIGNVATKDFYYRCAASAAWVEPQKLYLRIQIIDRYFGNMSVTIGFRDEVCGIYMEKCAEDFLDEYQGFAGGRIASQK